MCMVKGTCMTGGKHGRGGHAWQRGACMAGSMRSRGGIRKKYSAIIFLVEIHLARGGFCLGVSARGGVSGWESVYPGGCVWLDGVSAQGVSAWGVCLRGLLGWGCLPDTPLWTEWQTPVKTLPCRNYVADGKDSEVYLLLLAILNRYQDSIVTAQRWTCPPHRKL